MTLNTDVLNVLKYRGLIKMDEIDVLLAFMILIGIPIIILIILIKFGVM